MRQILFDGIKQFFVFFIIAVCFEYMRFELGSAKLIMFALQALLFTLFYQSFNRYLYQYGKIRLYFANKGQFLAYVIAELEKQGYYPTVKIGNIIYFEDKASLFKTQLKLEVRDRTAVLNCPISVKSSLKKTMGTYNLHHLARI